MLNVKEMLYRYAVKQTEFISDCLAATIVNRDTFTPYKNYSHFGKVVVCGAGPTLQKYQPVQNAIHIAVNRAFLYKKVDFDFIFAQDFDGIKMCQPEMVAYRRESCIKFLGIASDAKFGSKTIPESFAIKCDAKRFYIDNYLYKSGYDSKFICDIAHHPLGGMPNVGLSVLQLALWMNPSELYIVGCDMSGTHFSNANMSDRDVKEEQQKLNKYWESDQKRQLEKWREFKKFAGTYYPETKIIAVNPVGLKGIFEDLFQS